MSNQSRPSISRYLLDHLAELGVRHVFGIPGDYNLSFLDEIEARYRAWKRVMPASNAKQADFPRGAKVLSNAVGTAPGRRESDPGYWLIDRGRCDLENDLESRVPFKTRLFRVNSRLGVKSYIAMIAVFTLAALGLALWGMQEAGVRDGMLIVLALVGLIPASDVAIAFVNRLLTGTQHARPLPAMDLRNPPQSLPVAWCAELGLPDHATYAAGAEVFLHAFAGQTSLPWPCDFPRKTEVPDAKDVRELHPQPSDDSAFQP